MPSFSHDGLVRLFVNRPELAVELLRDVLGIDVPDYIDARIDSADLTDIEPATRYADLVVLLSGGAAAEPPSWSRSSSVSTTTSCWRGRRTWPTCGRACVARSSFSW
jgi:hypothetical protein